MKRNISFFLSLFTIMFTLTTANAASMSYNDGLLTISGIDENESAILIHAVYGIKFY